MSKLQDGNIPWSFYQILTICIRRRKALLSSILKNQNQNHITGNKQPILGLTHIPLLCLSSHPPVEVWSCLFTREGMVSSCCPHSLLRVPPVILEHLTKVTNDSLRANQSQVTSFLIFEFSALVTLDFPSIYSSYSF